MRKKLFIRSLKSLCINIHNSNSRIVEVIAFLTKQQTRMKHSECADGKCHYFARYANKMKFAKLRMIVLLVSLLILIIVKMFHSFEIDLSNVKDSLTNVECILDGDNIMTEITRPRVNCSLCVNLTSVAIVYNITKEEFIEKYAYTDVPLLFKGGAKHWSARKVFNFSYFRNLYSSHPGSLEEVDEKCQFFRYKTYFNKLDDVFQMSDARANNEPGQTTWYIGWCDGDTKTSEELKKHYARPEHLPLPSLETEGEVDWIFMGWPGEGANIHIDMVAKPSWQAQLKGQKTWILLPSPECDNVCSVTNVTLESGDILTVNTNVWYHSTFIHPGEMSISIGSEY